MRAAPAMPIVRPVTSAGDLSEFVRFPWAVYRSDPHWVPPLITEIERRLDVDENPFFAYAARELFLAWRGSTVVGRIAAIVNHQHNEQLGESTGFFGFYESVDDQAVAEALFAAAASWLGALGMTVMRGPVNGAPTDEAGILLTGYDRRPAMWEAHTPAYYRDLVERCGFVKYDDLFAYELWFNRLGPDLRSLPAAVWRILDRSGSLGSVRVRAVNRKRWDEEIATAHGLYNTAFRTIPGHTDMSLAKFRQLAATVRPVMDPELLLLAEVDGRPAGFAVTLPDLNEALCHLDGRLTPWALVKLYWYRRRIRTMCFKLIGVLPEFRGRGLETRLGFEMARRAIRRGYKRAELSLVSERNTGMRRLVARVGGEVYRSYRIYERRL